MMGRVHGSCWIIVVLTAVSVFEDVHCTLVRSRLGADDIHSSEVPNTELFTIHQHTPIIRSKRDAVDHVVFPPFMEFSFRFKDTKINLRLKRNEYMTSDVKLSDGNGRLQHELGRKTGIYSAMEHGASFVVQCEDHMEHCVLTGSMTKDGRMLDITPQLDTSQLHKAVETRTDTSLYFGNDGLPIPATTSAQDNSTRGVPEVDRDRQKRDIPQGCDIVECYAIVDESVWHFFLTLSGDDVAAAEAALTANYLALYTQADLHYDQIGVRRSGACIRLYLVGIRIQKNTDESWSFPNEIQPGFVEAVSGMTRCGAQGNSLRDSSTSIDLIQCYTRKDIVWDEGSGNSAFAFWRSLGFTQSVCREEFLIYSAAIIESTGDKVELLLAHEVGHGLGADHDSLVGCTDSDGYIMQKQMKISKDDFKLENIWYFSTCSVDAIYSYLGNLSTPTCLRSHGFSVAEYDTFQNQPLAGTIYSWQQQCVFRFGQNSTSCDPLGQSRTYFTDMCDRGIVCTLPDTDNTCAGKTRPYDGTPCGDLNAYCLKGECYIPPRDLGIICTADTDCSDVNGVCNDTSSTCTCRDGFYDDNGTTAGGTCQPEVSVGAACPREDSCRDPNAVCDNSVCTCKSGYYSDNGSCSLLKYAGAPCTSTAQCNGDNVECSGSPSTCRCAADHQYQFDTGNCTPNPTAPSTTTSTPVEDNNCAPIGVWAIVPGMKKWCNNNCPDYCPTDRCNCA